MTASTHYARIASYVKSIAALDKELRIMDRLLKGKK